MAPAFTLTGVDDKHRNQDIALDDLLAAGKPILAMIDGEGAEVVRLAEAGLTAPAGDAAAFAAAVRQMMAMPPVQRLAMGRRGSEYAQREFDRDSVVSRLENWLEDLVVRQRTNPPADRPTR